MDRRKFLGTGAVLLSSGCVSSEQPAENGSRADPPQNASPSVESETHPPECPEADVRLETAASAVSDSLDGWTIAPRDESVQQGETLVVSVTNESGERRGAGSPSKYEIHRKADGTWRSIFWGDEDVGFTDGGWGTDPGDGFTWELTMTRDGLSHEVEHGDGAVVVCSPISAGRYRFLFTPIATFGDDGIETVLGVEFTVE